MRTHDARVVTGYKPLSMSTASTTLTNAERPTDDRPPVVRERVDPTQGYWFGSAVGHARALESRLAAMKAALTATEAELALLHDKHLALVARLEAIEKQLVEREPGPSNGAPAAPPTKRRGR